MADGFHEWRKNDGRRRTPFFSDLSPPPISPLRGATALLFRKPGIVASDATGEMKSIRQRKFEFSHPAVKLLCLDWIFGPLTKMVRLRIYRQVAGSKRIELPFLFLAIGHGFIVCHRLKVAFGTAAGGVPSTGGRTRYHPSRANAVAWRVVTAC